MKHINYQYKIKIEKEEVFEQLKKSLLESEEISQIRKELGIDDKLFEQDDTLVKLDRYLNIKNQCRNCPGLECNLPSKIKTILSVQNNYLKEERVLCDFYHKQVKIRESFAFDNGKYYIEDESKINKKVNLAVIKFFISLNKKEKSLTFAENGLFNSNEITYFTYYEIQKYASENKDKKISFIDFPNLIETLSFNTEDKEHLNNTLSYILSADIIIIDRFGAEKISNFARDNIFMEIITRAKHSCSILINSLYSLNDLPRHLLCKGEHINSERIRFICNELKKFNR